MMKRSGEEDSDAEGPRQRARLDTSLASASNEAQEASVARASVAIANATSNWAASDVSSSSSDNEGAATRAMKSDKTDPSEDGMEEDTAEQGDPSKEPLSSSDKPPAKLSYPKPKNFAERLMNAVERGIASESVWWVGGGKAIALHPGNLKTCPELTEYFKAKDYSGFIRNCNRWGFRRVSHYPVEPGIVTYENSLFQQDQPHLVKHMRMDSDVQDVFARHQGGGDEDPGLPEGKPPKGSNKGKGKRRPRVKGPSVDPNQGGNSEDLIEDFKKSGQLTPDLRAALAALSRSSDSREAQQPTDESTLSKEFLLRKILQLTEQFLDHPGSLYSDDASFQTTMQLVRALGQQHQQELLAQGHLAPILRLEAALQPGASQSQQQGPSSASASLFPSLNAPSQGLFRTSNPLEQLSGRTATRTGSSSNPFHGLLIGNPSTAQGIQQQIPHASLHNHSANLLENVLASQHRPPQPGQGQAPQAGRPPEGREQLLNRLISAQKERVLREREQQQQQDQRHHEEEKSDGTSHENNERELLERVMAMQRREEQIQEQKADQPYPFAAAAQEPPPQGQQEGSDPNRRESQQFTSAQELLLRVMTQNRRQDR